MSALLYSKLAVAKVSHDLAGVIGAVSNSLDLLAQSELLDQETLALALENAKVASVRLAFFRAAYGIDGTVMNVDMAHHTLQNYFDSLENVSTKFELKWNVDSQIHMFMSKLILLSGQLAAEALMRGGQIEIQAKAGQKSILVKAMGKKIALDENIAHILMQKNPPTLPKQISAVYLIDMLKEKEWKLEVVRQETYLELKMSCQEVSLTGK